MVSMSGPERAIATPLSASIELLPKQVLETDQLARLLPQGTRVYLGDIGSSGTPAEMLIAARRLKDAGCLPVPHLAARRIESREALESRVGRLAEEAGVDDVLVIGGGVPRPRGPYADTMSLLETSVLDRFGIRDLAVAGHPEGSPDFSEEAALKYLEDKRVFADRTGARLRIVTQFGFDPMGVMAWVDHLASIGIDVPVHVGVAGPASVATLIKYAALCGVGNSVSMLKKATGNALSLATGHSPETFVSPLERSLASQPNQQIAQMHVYPFGGLERASRWLRERTSWQ